jgi:hypothetical protein
MPIRVIHNGFDGYLVEKGYPPDGYDYDIVHARIDRGVQWYGGAHRELDFYHSEDGLRDWLTGMQNRGAAQDKLTAYLRCGLAHFALDEADTRWYDRDPEGYVTLPWDKVYEGALKSMLALGLHRKFFKGHNIGS